MSHYTRAWRLAAVLAFTLAAGFSASATAAGLDAGHDAWIKDSTQVLDFPKGGAKPVARLVTGTKVQLKASEDAMGHRWWLVESGEAKGWVRERVLSSEAISAEQLAAEAPLPAPEFKAPTEGQDRSADLARLWTAINTGTVEDRAHACQLLPYSGLTDPLFFDALETWLQHRYTTAARDNVPVQADVTRCLQGLASSGSPKYMATLQKWEMSPQTGSGGRNFIRRAEVFLSESSQYNAAINKPDSHTGERSWATSRVINMIQDANPVLQREGMRRLAHHARDYAGVFDILEAQLLTSYKPAFGDPVLEDTLAWGCKTLAVSRNAKFAPSLTKIAGDTPSLKIKSNCEGALRTLDDDPPDEESPEELR